LSAALVGKRVLAVSNEGFQDAGVASAEHKKRATKEEISKAWEYAPASGSSSNACPESWSNVGLKVETKSGMLNDLMNVDR